MKRLIVSLLGGFLVSLTATLTAGHAMQAKEQKLSRSQLPPAVVDALNANCAGCSIDKATREIEHGVTIYDIEFKRGRGEIAIAEDGSVIDREIAVQLKDVPAAALDAIRKAASGARIKQVARGEIRAELKEGQITRLANPRYVYEAELLRGSEVAEVEVTSDGEVIEAAEWKKRSVKEKPDH